MMIVDTVKELDGLYAIYKSLLEKEFQSIDAMLAAPDLETKKPLAKQARLYSEQASKVAKTIKDIEDCQD
jgi:hypothetical protein